jgi:hypothetical protein
VKPPLTVERLRPYVEEAVNRFGVRQDIDELAEQFIRHHLNPAAMRDTGVLETVFHRALANEHLDYERREHETGLVEFDWVCKGVKILTDQSCRLADQRFSGAVFTDPPLPVLPLPDCPAPYCMCFYMCISP